MSGPAAATVADTIVRLRARRLARSGTILLLLLASGGAAARQAVAVDWRALTRLRDRDRLRDWRVAWTAALASARGGGAGARIAVEGVLLQPDAAVVPPEAPDGAYRCRVIKLGAALPGGVAYVVQPPVRCRIVDGTFALLGGAQRPAGRLWPSDGLRLVFLGAVALGDESGALDYGRDPDRDAAGVFERIGPNRWRLVLPRPQWQSILDVIEIMPAPPRSAGE